MTEVPENSDPNERAYFKSPGPLTFDKIKSIIGPPPVLSNESAEAYNAMLLHYMNAMGPRDFLLQMFVKDLMHTDWESLRYKRHKAWVVELKDRLTRELHARRLKLSQSKTGPEEKPETESERLFGLEFEVQVLADNAIERATLGKGPRDIELAHAMEQAINYYERLDRLEKDSLTKRVIIQEQIRLYDEVLREKTEEPTP